METGDLLGVFSQCALQCVTEAREEGAVALMAGTRRACPVRGADPEHQHEVHGLETVDMSQKAVVAEMAKIRAESADLKHIMGSLSAEREGLIARRRKGGTPQASRLRHRERSTSGTAGQEVVRRDRPDPAEKPRRPRTEEAY